jgi:hypothetical protein
MEETLSKGQPSDGPGLVAVSRKDTNLLKPSEIRAMFVVE